MATRLAPSIAQLDLPRAISSEYDIAVWAAGYEARSCWLIQSRFKPIAVRRWWKIEFVEHRTVHDGAAALGVECGDVLGGKPGRRNHDGYWATQWSKTISAAFRSARRPINIFVDYSSMPRAVYGSLLVEAFLHLADKINSITFAYVPGIHTAEMNGSRGVQGLRGLIGTDGSFSHQETAFIIGLGYDGILSETIIELFHVTHFSCMYAAPGVSDDGADRVLAVNSSLLSRAELVATAPAWSVEHAVHEVDRLCDWYMDQRDVLLVPVGPKPHVMACILTAIMRDDVGFRFPDSAFLRPSPVRVAERAVPYLTRITF